ncbi:hypothetical protein DDB_G0282957 [Dictyostelium discoideum AX4]|uniref:Uncharacterized protein DDB_G0282957 n=1 Tax=Dictyostelium discoideum TaxID=44689 RepID=Y2856_DICDI|nr:hypothetical protein DDB_G0282957 [Dictyostelium discoideum AX4]Q54RS2.1 RecName: Full=Uncharacterized protein DDB_G0282957 [Dictyostelium discoideum]EAL65922.1 hypothetical protein DDB_G0282957 [Dictyostelium discoideum AX4]|eukprot:XP_639279.1 hypothetical protein DDB_G0282957 [Dictyostelium discoideum AX4]
MDENEYDEYTQISWSDTIKGLIKDPESRNSILENLKNISVFIASSMIIAKYAHKICEPQLLSKILFES